MSFRIVIPARHGSSRLPGKPLIEIAGKPMIQHVLERAQASQAYEVIIATDDIRIEQVARGLGADVCMTSTNHLSGTDRLAEVATMRNFDDRDIIVNVQGDEPYLPPDLINQVAEDLNNHQDADIATLYSPIIQEKHIFDSNVVKVVMDQDGYALYFSRAPIPWIREDSSIDLSSSPKLPQYRHIGIYSYQAEFLKNYSELRPCILEQAESLEQLRAMFYRKKIHLSIAQVDVGHSVDTEDDLMEIRSLIV